MSSISRIAFSLSLLTIVSLHAMQKHTSKEKQIKQLSTDDIHNNFRKDATNLVLKQTFHVLTEGEVPGAADVKPTDPDGFDGSLPQRVVVRSVDKAQELIISKIDLFFATRIDELKQHDDPQDMSNMLLNGMKIYFGNDDNGNRDYAKNFFSKLVLKKNKEYFMKNERYGSTVTEKTIYDFSHAL